MQITIAKQINLLHREKIERKRFHYTGHSYRIATVFYKVYVLHKRTLEGILNHSRGVTAKKCEKGMLHKQSVEFVDKPNCFLTFSLLKLSKNRK